jgi:hypothetical protein
MGCELPRTPKSRSSGQRESLHSPTPIGLDARYVARLYPRVLCARTIRVNSGGVLRCLGRPKAKAAPAMLGCGAASSEGVGRVLQGEGTRPTLGLLYVAPKLSASAIGAYLHDV